MASPNNCRNNYGFIVCEEQQGFPINSSNQNTFIHSQFDQTYVKMGHLKAIFNLFNLTNGFPQYSTAESVLLNPVEGAHIYNTDLHRDQLWDGTNWITL